MENKEAKSGALSLESEIQKAVEQRKQWDAVARSNGFASYEDYLVQKAKFDASVHARLVNALGKIDPNYQELF